MGVSYTGIWIVCIVCLPFSSSSSFVHFDLAYHRLLVYNSTKEHGCGR